MRLYIITLFFCFLNKFVANYVVIPFNIKPKIINKTLDIKEQLQIYLERESYVSTISFGNESQGLELNLSLNEYPFLLTNDICSPNSKSSYNPFLSTSFKNITEYKTLYINIKNFKAIEKCSLYNNIYLNQNISINNLSFIFFEKEMKGKIDNLTKVCGNIGLQIFNSYGNLYKNDYFVNSLIKSQAINSYSWSIIYLNNSVSKNDFINYTNKDYEGILICGIKESDYREIFKTDNIRYAYAQPIFNNIFWDLGDIKISFKDSKKNEDVYESLDNIITFNNEINYIRSTKSYFNSIKEYFFKDYINKNICTYIEKLAPLNSNIIICQKEIMNKISNFPKLSFTHKVLDFVFELTYNDLFIELNDKILFLVIYNTYGQDFWSVGRLFMKKYPFIFDYDKKTISFVNIYNINKSDKIKKEENNKNTKNSYLKFCIVCIIILIGIIIGILIGRLLLQKNRKKRANELDDNFEYVDNKIINNNEELIKEDIHNKDNPLFNNIFH